MSPIGPSEELPGEEFARHARGVLEESVMRIDGRIRSRLNQARHAALGQAARRPSFWSRFTLMPAAGAVAAAVLVAFVLWPHSRPADFSAEGTRATVEDLDLIADGDALDLVSDETDGAFYEWAVEQPETSETSS
ncbi:MAG TPA: hypothetical protein VLX90_04955 [Steroidobacteraceae bacterium]|nr:hypothetical protein [Steroidobacteraceae bacterium]